MKATLVGLVCMIAIGSAAETTTFPIEVGSLKVGVRAYDEAKIVGVDSIGVKVVHASGTARVPFDQLPDDLRTRFNHDREAAKQQAKLEAEASKAYERQLQDSQVEVSLREESVDSSGETPVKRRSEADLMREAIRAEQLQGYVFRLKSGIIRTESEILKRMLKAQQSQFRAYASRGPYSSRSFRAAGRAVGVYVKTLPEREKIAQAKLLIQYAEREIERMESGR